MPGRRPSVAPGGLLVAALTAACASIALEDLETPAPVPEGACVVVGFLGGLDVWNERGKAARRLALDLRDPAAGRYAETFENRRLDVATAFARRSLDADGDGSISPSERARARWVVYGQSLGGNTATWLARRLETLGVDVELLLLLDSVGPWDEPVPANVNHVVVLFQDEGWVIRGEATPETVDPGVTAVTRREFDYDRPPGSEIAIGDLPWWKIAFRVAHSRMDRDPRVWALARARIEAACANRAEADDQNRSPPASRRWLPTGRMRGHIVQK